MARPRLQAVVLVGGVGTRLRPLTYTTPKPLLPVVRRPILEHVVGNLARGGVTEVVLAIGFKPDAFIAAYPDGRCAGVELTYAVEPEPLDTAGAIAFAANHAGIDETFVVANGDVLTDLDVGDLLRFHRLHDAEGTLHLTGVDDPSAFGVVAADADGRVLAFVEKPMLHEAPSKHVNAGTYIFEPSVLSRIASNEKVSVERHTFPSMVADGRLYAMATTDYWLDAGRPEQFRQANLDFLDGLRRETVEGVGPDVNVAADADVRRSVVGPRGAIRTGARVVDSVVLKGVEIGVGAVVESCVLGAGVVVGRGAVLRNCVFGDSGVAEPGQRLSDALVPDPA